MDVALATKTPATARQLEELRTQFNLKYQPEQAAEFHQWLNTHRLSMATASDRLQALWQMPAVNELVEGMYKVGDDIFKVYRTQKNILVTKQRTSEGFEYTGKRPLKFITAEHRMTLEEAKAFGKVTSTCCDCGKKLTNEESIANGIGPICAAKF